MTSDPATSSAKPGGPGPSEEASLLETARGVLEQASFAALATLAPGGGPFASLVALAPSEDGGGPVLLLSRLAVHTRNLAGDPRASLLILGAPGASGEDLLAGPRLTLTGTVVSVGRDVVTRARFLARHHEAAGYVDFADFGFYRLRPTAVHLVAGFGRIGDIPPAALLGPTRS